MITVIIPTLNEQNTISQVIELVEKSTSVSEILIIDDKSLDNTIKKAREKKVKIYTSTKLGKGASMYEGMLFATGDIIVFLDADIITYPENIIDLLTEPI
jgi:glycosyltransferase involved in cell wall biosynthesis